VRALIVLVGGCCEQLALPGSICTNANGCAVSVCHQLTAIMGCRGRGPGDPPRTLLPDGASIFRLFWPKRIAAVRPCAMVSSMIAGHRRSPGGCDLVSGPQSFKSFRAWQHRRHGQALGGPGISRRKTRPVNNTGAPKGIEGAGAYRRFCGGGFCPDLDRRPARAMGYTGCRTPWTMMRRKCTL